MDGKGVNSGDGGHPHAAGRAVGQLLFWRVTLAAACPTERACFLLFGCGQIRRRRPKVPIDLARRRALLETYISEESLCRNAGKWSMATRTLEMRSHLRPVVRCRLPGQLMRFTNPWTARAAGYPVVRFESFWCVAVPAAGITLRGRPEFERSTTMPLCSVPPKRKNC